MNDNFNDRFVELANSIKGPIVLRGKAAEWMIEYLRTHPPDLDRIKRQMEKDKDAVKRLEEMGVTICTK